MGLELRAFVGLISHNEERLYAGCFLASDSSPPPAVRRGVPTFCFGKKEGSLFFSLHADEMFFSNLSLHIDEIFCNRIMMFFPCQRYGGGSLLFVSAKSRQKPSDTLSLAKSLYSPFPGRRSQSASLCRLICSQCLMDYAVLPSSVPETGRGILRRSLLHRREACVLWTLARRAKRPAGGE